MQTEPARSGLFPNRTPTWSDLFLLVAVAVFFGSSSPRLLADGIGSLPAIGAAFVGVLVLMVASQFLQRRSKQARRLQRRFRELRLAGRVAIVAVIVAGAVLVAVTLPVSDSTHWGFAVGIMGGVGAYLAVWMLRAGEISGWWGRWKLPTGVGRR